MFLGFLFLQPFMGCVVYKNKEIHKIHDKTKLLTNSYFSFFLISVFIQGLQGFKGSHGRIGYTGLPGVTGLRGHKGDSGDKGRQVNTQGKTIKYN